MASRIAAHAADIVKGVKGARDWDLKMSLARKSLNWEAQSKLSIDPEHFQIVTANMLLRKGLQYVRWILRYALVEEYLGVSAPRC